jgi:hypothetical protein
VNTQSKGPRSTENPFSFKTFTPSDSLLEGCFLPALKYHGGWGRALPKRRRSLLVLLPAPLFTYHNNTVQAFSAQDPHSTFLLQFKPNSIHYDRVISHCIIAFFKMSGHSSWLQKMRKGELVELCDSVGYKEYETSADLTFLQQIG